MDRSKRETVLNIVNHYNTNGMSSTKDKFNIKGSTVRRYVRRYKNYFKEESRQAKILLFDIENSPNEVHTWNLWNQNVAPNQVIHPWYILSWSAKWLGEDGVFFDALSNYPDEFKKDHRNDKFVCQSMWDLLDESDIIIGHNSIKHDIPKLKAQFVKHNMMPYSPVKHIDTYRAIKGMAFASKSLNFVARDLGIGQKLAHTGHQLWKDCMNPILDEDAWKMMIEYNCMDVELEEKVYLRIRPWIANHPNVNLYSKQRIVSCNKCGGVVVEDGDAITQANVYQGYRCTECGAWSRSRYQKITSEDKKRILTNYL